MNSSERVSECSNLTQVVISGIRVAKRLWIIEAGFLTQFLFALDLLQFLSSVKQII